MSETPDLSNISQYLGVGENTIKRWEDEGLIKPIRLPKGSIRQVTRETLDHSAAEGTLYGPLPRGLIDTLAASIEEPEQPSA
jgi:hypothetical protein